MRLARTFIVLALCSAPLAVAACSGGGGGGDNGPYATYQACWDDHHNVESFTVQQAIVICCHDHPIGSQPMNVVCGTTTGDCEAYVGSNLMGSDVTPADITQACSDYIAQRNM